MNAGFVRQALVRHLYWMQTLVVPEFELDGGKCDVVQISKANFATEYEIKVSRSDWNADKGKSKWAKHRPHISRFFYVVPRDIAEPIPVWVPDSCGVLIVEGETVRELRAAKRFKASKINAETRERALEAFYFRYWRHESAMSEARSELTRMRKTCPKCWMRMSCEVCDKQRQQVAA